MFRPRGARERGPSDVDNVDDGESAWTQRIGCVRANDCAPGWGDVVFVLDRGKWVGVGGDVGVDVDDERAAGSWTRDVVRGDAGERARVGGTETGFEVDFDVVRARVQLDV